MFDDVKIEDEVKLQDTEDTPSELKEEDMEQVAGGVARRSSIDGKWYDYRPINGKVEKLPMNKLNNFLKELQNK